MTAPSLLLEVAFKATLLFAAAALVAFSMRNAAASLRHFIWSCAVVGALAVPGLTLTLPGWQLGIFSPLSAETATSPRVTSSNIPVIADRVVNLGDPVDVTTQPTDVPMPALQSESPTAHARIDWPTALVFLWLGGIAAGIITIVGGLVTLRRLARNSRDLTDANWLELVNAISRDLGIERPVRAIVSNAATMPATWGLFRPTVLLPGDAETWDEERRRVVMLHELAHVRRNDCLMQIVAQLCCAVYWFHPAAWYAARRLRSERELACDEQVLGLGVNACDYAAHLLEIATRFRAPAHTSIAAVAMARPSQLEGRLVAILSGRVAPRSKSSARIRISAFAGLVAFTLPLAAMRPWKTMPNNTGAPKPSAASLNNDIVSPAPSTVSLAALAPADTFRWKGVVPAGKWVEVLARYSEIRAELAPGSSVEIVAVRKIGTPGSYQIAMETKAGGPRFCVVSRETASVARPCDRDVSGVLKNGPANTRVDFLIRVPAGVGISAHTGRGNIEADGVDSYVWGTSGRGDISIVTSDLAEASTNGGSISARFGRRSWRQDLEFLTDSGNVTVVAPTDANMMIEAETSLGQVTSEFGGSARPFGEGQQIMTRTGQGGGMLTLRSGRGRVELKRGARAVADRSSITFVYADAPLVSLDPKPNDNPNPDDDPNPDPGYNPNPNPDYNANPNPEYNPDENPIPELEADAQANGETGERLPVSIPPDLINRFSQSRIASWPDARAIARLRDIAATHRKQHPNDYVRERSQWALTLVRNGEIVAPLRAALSSADWRERAYAAWALGETQDPRAAAALTTALGDAHWRVRMHAAAGLERIGGPTSVPPLISALDDAYWQVRIAAVDALAASGDARALAALQRVAARDPRSIVRDEARSAIERIK